jgi:hypothetical protein
VVSLLAVRESKWSATARGRDVRSRGARRFGQSLLTPAIGVRVIGEIGSFDRVSHKFLGLKGLGEEQGWSKPLIEALIVFQLPEYSLDWARLPSTSVLAGRG